MEFSIAEIEASASPHIDTYEAGLFFKLLTGKEKVSAFFSSKPKCLFVHTLKYAYPSGHSFASGFLFSITLDQLEQMDVDRTKDYLVGQLHFEIETDGTVKVNASAF